MENIYELSVVNWKELFLSVNLLMKVLIFRLTSWLIPILFSLISDDFIVFNVCQNAFNFQFFCCNSQQSVDLICPISWSQLIKLCKNDFIWTILNMAWAIISHPFICSVRACPCWAHLVHQLLTNDSISFELKTKNSVRSVKNHLKNFWIVVDRSNLKGRSGIKCLLSEFLGQALQL